MTYLDHNATSPLHPAALSAMQEAYAFPANPSSIHSHGRRARAMLDSARKAIAERLSCFPHELIFTASGTEANNLALRGITGRRRIVSAIEHPSVLKTAEGAAIIPVHENGIVNLGALETELAKDSSPALVSIMLANNETGVIQPVAEAAAIAKRYGALMHTDAVQAFGKIPVDMGVLSVDLLTVSAHKLGAPVGAGALIVKDGTMLHPMLTGGAQEERRRAGTENLAAICGFAAIAALDLFSHWKQVEIWLQNTHLQPIAKDSAKLPNTRAIAMPGVKNETQLMAFDLEGIAVSAGSACSSGRVEVSHVLKAMQVREPETVIRVSAGWNTTEQDIRKFTDAWSKLMARTQPAKAA